MSHKLKGLSLALMAMFVLGAVVASSASATAAAVTSNAGATISGSQIEGEITGKKVKANEFTSKVGTIKCTTVTFDGVAAANEAVEQTLTPTFSGCSLAGSITVHITMNGCNLLFTAGETVGGNANTITATVDVKCPEGKKVEVIGTGTTCVITAAAKNGLGSIELRNVGSGGAMESEVTFDITGIPYEAHGACPNEPTATVLTTDATYRGVAKLQANGANGITVH